MLDNIECLGHSTVKIKDENFNIAIKYFYLQKRKYHIQY